MRIRITVVLVLLAALTASFAVPAGACTNFLITKGASTDGSGMITYAAAKGAINNMVRGWAKEFAPRGITVNATAPGVIWTRIHQDNTDPEELKKLIKRIPLGRKGMPQDCSGAVLLLASNEGCYITGHIIEINGGMQMP